MCFILHDVDSRAIGAIRNLGAAALIRHTQTSPDYFQLPLDFPGRFQIYMITIHINSLFSFLPYVTSYFFPISVMYRSYPRQIFSFWQSIRTQRMTNFYNLGLGREYLGRDISRPGWRWHSFPSWSRNMAQMVRCPFTRRPSFSLVLGTKALEGLRWRMSL